MTAKKTKKTKKTSQNTVRCFSEAEALGVARVLSDLISYELGDFKVQLAPLGVVDVQAYCKPTVFGRTVVMQWHLDVAGSKAPLNNPDAVPRASHLRVASCIRLALCTMMEVVSASLYVP